MTERINVAAKTLFNRIHAAIALVFWILLGFFLSRVLELELRLSHWLSLLISLALGIGVGVVRMFIINGRYAWQVATIEEIRDLKAMLEEKLK